MKPITLQTAIINAIKNRSGEFSIFDITRDIRTAVNLGRISIKHCDGSTKQIGHQIVRELFEEILDENLVPGLVFLRVNSDGYRLFRVAADTVVPLLKPLSFSSEVSRTEATTSKKTLLFALNDFMSRWRDRKVDLSLGEDHILYFTMKEIQSRIRSRGNFTCKEIYDALAEMGCEFIIGYRNHHSTIQLIFK